MNEAFQQLMTKKITRHFIMEHDKHGSITVYIHEYTRAVNN